MSILVNKDENINNNDTNINTIKIVSMHTPRKKTAKTAHKNEIVGDLWNLKDLLHQLDINNITNSNDQNNIITRLLIEMSGLTNLCRRSAHHHCCTQGIKINIQAIHSIIAKPSEFGRRTSLHKPGISKRNLTVPLLYKYITHT